MEAMRVLKHLRFLDMSHDHLGRIGFWSYCNAALLNNVIPSIALLNVDGLPHVKVGFRITLHEDLFIDMFEADRKCFVQSSYVHQRQRISNEPYYTSHKLGANAFLLNVLISLHWVGYGGNFYCGTRGLCSD